MSLCCRARLHPARERLHVRATTRAAQPTMRVGERVGLGIQFAESRTSGEKLSSRARMALAAALAAALAVPLLPLLRLLRLRRPDLASGGPHRRLLV